MKEEKNSQEFALYYRVSTDKQGDSGLGLDAQRKICQGYVENQKGQIIKEIIEIETGTSKIRISHDKPFSLENLLNKRPKLKELIDFCKKQKTILVVYDLSRLGRNQLLISYLIQAGIKFICAVSPSDDPFILQIKAAVFEEEARNISRRTKVALAQKKAQGFKLGNPKLENVDRRTKALSNIKTAQDFYKNIIQLIKKYREEKQASYRKIAEELNSFGFKTRENKKFYGITVKRILERNKLKS